MIDMDLLCYTDEQKARLLEIHEEIASLNRQIELLVREKDDIYRSGKAASFEKFIIKYGYVANKLRETGCNEHFIQFHMQELYFEKIGYGLQQFVENEKEE